MVLIFLREWSNESHNHVGLPVSRPRHLVRKLLVEICALCVLLVFYETIQNVEWLLLMGQMYYPTLECDIQVFGPWGSVPNTDHGGSRIFRRSGFWDLYLGRKMYELSCFGVKKVFPKGDLVLWSTYCDKFPLCMNQQMNEKIMGFTEHNGNTSNGEALIDKLNIKSLEIYENLKNIAQFNLKLFYQL